MVNDNYIVRIYRRDKSNPRLMVGTVEEVGSREKKGFTSFDELREILGSRSGGASRKKKPPGSSVDSHQGRTKPGDPG